MQECAKGGGVDRILEVRIGEHDQGVLSAKLEHHPLQVSGRLLGEQAPGLCRPSKADPPHLRVFHEFIDNRLSLARRVGDDVDHAGREAGFLEDLGVNEATGDG